MAVSFLDDPQVKAIDAAHYARFGFSPPDLPRAERQLRRLMYRNERSLHRRKCDLTGRSIVSLFSEDSPNTVYSLAAWWSDEWDGLSFGRAFDFSRTFFEQFEELYRIAPLPSYRVSNCENCDYNHAILNSKNCYRNARVDASEEIYFSRSVYNSRDCMDCFDVRESELCYECSRCIKCFSCYYSQQCENCSDIFACYDCRGSQSCIGCVNLRQKSYHILNEPVSVEEFRSYRALLDSDADTRAGFFAAYAKLLQSSPRRALIYLNAENCNGDFISNSSGCSECFEIADCQDCALLHGCGGCRDCIDGEFNLNCERTFNSIGNAGAYNANCVIELANGRDQSYTIACYNNCRSLFGCVGLKQRSFCILNKQYDEADYAALSTKIIEHMKETGEWGVFFPAEMSPFAYNETVAPFYVPLTRADALARKLRWSEPVASVPPKEKVLLSEQIPHQADESILGKVLLCGVTGKPYEIIPQELKFYQKMTLPIPREHPDERQRRRMAEATRTRLYPGVCAKTGRPIETSYPPGSPYTIYDSRVFAEEYS